MKHFFTIFALLIVFASSTLIAQTNWAKNINNPILSSGGSGWESTSVYCPFVLKNGEIWKMWYNGDNGTYTQIGYAESQDGITWTKIDSVNPVLEVGPLGSWDDMALFNPQIIFDGSTYHMWYGGWDGTVITNPPYFVNGRWGYATSLDGINWTKHDDPSTTSLPFAQSDPVFGLGTPGSWDAQGHLGGTIQVIDSVYHMWYGGFDGLNARIGHAISTNGIQWEPNTNNNPVLEIGTPGGWDDSFVYFPHVLYNPQSVKYEMWYTGSQNGILEQIGYATSLDGISWVKDTLNNPVLSPEPGSSWENNFVNIPIVLFDGGNYKMWYNGAGNYTQIGYATAPIDPVGINDNVYKNIPEGFVLSQNYPNPFNPSTNIEFSIPKAEFVTLKIYNLLGQEVMELVAKRLTHGNYKYTWNAGSLASGVYIYKLQAGNFLQVRKMVYLK